MKRSIISKLALFARLSAPFPAGRKFFVGHILLIHFLVNYTIILATFATAGQRSATSFAIGPLKIVPFGFPFSSFNTTAALSSNLILVPSARRYSFLWRTITAKHSFPHL